MTSIYPERLTRSG